jgi:Fe-S cluster biogenesis protein NfuA
MSGNGTAPHPNIDRDVVEDRLARVAKALDAHAGGIELVRIEADGEVRVRFTGMCTGCPLRPVSLNGLVRPALESVDGVTRVAAEGGRISAEAEARLFNALSEWGSGCLIDAITGDPDEDVPVGP